MQLLYASRDGHAHRIADHIAARLADAAIAAVPQNVADSDPAAFEPNALVVLVAAVRYGKHLPEAERFLSRFCRLQMRPPLAFLSVNLTARKPNKKTAENNPYLRKLLHRHALKPVLAQAIAGRLDYPRYTRFDRFMIRLIMTMTAGPTDPTAVVEFTDWNEVDDLAGRIAQLTRESPVTAESTVR